MCFEKSTLTVKFNKHVSVIWAKNVSAILHSKGIATNALFTKQYELTIGCLEVQWWVPPTYKYHCHLWGQLKTLQQGSCSVLKQGSYSVLAYESHTIIRIPRITNWILWLPKWLLIICKFYNTAASRTYKYLGIQGKWKY